MVWRVMGGRGGVESDGRGCGVVTAVKGGGSGEECERKW